MRTSWIIVASFLSVVSIVYLYLKNKVKKTKEMSDGRLGNITSSGDSDNSIQRAVRYNDKEKSKVS